MRRIVYMHSSVHPIYSEARHYGDGSSLVRVFHALDGRELGLFECATSEARKLAYKHMRRCKRRLAAHLDPSF